MSRSRTALAVLHEHGAVRRLKQDIVARVAGFEFGGDLLVEIVVGVLGFPQAVNEAEAVEQRAVGRDPGAGLGLERVLRNQLPLVGAALVDERGAILEERLKGSADGGLMGDTKRAELRERLMVSADALVIRFQGKRAHAAQLVPERERGNNFSMPAAGRSGYESARASVARSVNTTQVVANWLIGREIVEDQQQGKKRAGCGQALLADLAERLSQEFGKGWSARQLEYCRSLYLSYPLLIVPEKSNAVRTNLSPVAATPEPHLGDGHRDRLRSATLDAVR